MSLETKIDENLVNCKVTITLIDFDTGHPIQETVIIKKPKKTRFGELALEAVGFFNSIFEQKNCKYRIDSKATNYKVLPSAENKLQKYFQTLFLLSIKKVGVLLLLFHFVFSHYINIVHLNCF